MKTTTLLLYLAAAGVGGALLARALFKPSTPTRAPLPQCPGDRYTVDPSAPSGWRCSDVLAQRTTTDWSY